MLRRYWTLFWDFDGVIKESVAVKSDAYERLFAPFGALSVLFIAGHGSEPPRSDTAFIGHHVALLAWLVFPLLAVAICWLGLGLAYFFGYPVGFYISTVAFGAYLTARLVRAAVDRFRVRGGV